MCTSPGRQRSQRNSQGGAAPGGHDVKHGEDVDDEAQLLVWQQGVQGHKAQRGQQQGEGPPVHKAQGHEEQAAAQAAGQGRVEVPQQRGGLGSGSRSPRVCEPLEHSGRAGS